MTARTCAPSSYLNDTWNWGGSSRNSATLVTETVWGYFLRASAKVRKAYGKLLVGARVALVQTLGLDPRQLGGRSGLV